MVIFGPPKKMSVRAFRISNVPRGVQTQLLRAPRAICRPGISVTVEPIEEPIDVAALKVKANVKRVVDFFHAGVLRGQYFIILDEVVNHEVNQEEASQEDSQEDSREDSQEASQQASQEVPFLHPLSEGLIASVVYDGAPMGIGFSNLDCHYGVVDHPRFGGSHYARASIRVAAICGRAKPCRTVPRCLQLICGGITRMSV